MESLAENIARHNIPQPSFWDGNILCIEQNAAISGSFDSETRVSTYGFFHVISGSITIWYNERNYELKAGDMLVQLPGYPYQVLSVSGDFLARSIYADSRHVMEQSPQIARNFVRLSWLLNVGVRGNCIKLSDDISSRLQKIVQLGILYHNSSRNNYDALTLLFGLYALDVVNYIQHGIPVTDFNSRNEELFLRFVGLMLGNYLEHKEIGFYSERLNISKTYLSKIVQRITGTTVRDYIDRLLMLDAVHLVRYSPLSMTEIADRLHFADVASFSKFFSRRQGMPPTEYRKITGAIPDNPSALPDSPDRLRNR